MSHFEFFWPKIHTVTNLHFLSKNSTLISCENCQFFGWKIRENVVVLDFLAVDNFDFTRKIVINIWWKTRENVGVLSKLQSDKKDVLSKNRWFPPLIQRKPKKTSKDTYSLAFWKLTLVGSALAFVHRLRPALRFATVSLAAGSRVRPDLMSQSVSLNMHLHT